VCAGCLVYRNGFRSGSSHLFHRLSSRLAHYHSSHTSGAAGALLRSGFIRGYSLSKLRRVEQLTIGLGLPVLRHSHSPRHPLFLDAAGVWPLFPIVQALLIPYMVAVCRAPLCLENNKTYLLPSSLFPRSALAHRPGSLCLVGQPVLSSSVECPCVTRGCTRVFPLLSVRAFSRVLDVVPLHYDRRHRGCGLDWRVRDPRRDFLHDSQPGRRGCRCAAVWTG